MSQSTQNPLHPSIFPMSRGKWQPNNKHETCQLCNTKFSGGVFKSGKHHCRKCGFVICGQCSDYSLKKQTVCKSCYNKYSKYENVDNPNKVFTLLRT